MRSGLSALSRNGDVRARPWCVKGWRLADTARGPCLVLWLETQADAVLDLGLRQPEDTADSGTPLLVRSYGTATDAEPYTVTEPRPATEPWKRKTSAFVRGRLCPEALP